MSLGLLLAIAGAELVLPRPGVGWVLFGESSVVGSATGEALERRLHDRSSLELVRLSPGSLLDCAGEPSCMLDRARSQAPRLIGLLVMTAYPRRGGQEWVTSSLVARAGEESRVWIVDPEPRGMAEPDVEEYVARLVEALAGVPGLAARLSPPAELHLRGLSTGDEVRLDGVVVVGAAPELVLRLRGLSAERHRLEVRSPTRASFAMDVDAGAGGSLEVRVPSEALLSHPVSTLGGVGVAAAGVGLVAAAIALSLASSPEDCFRAAGGPCPESPGMVRLTYDPSHPASVGAGPLLAPLGASLILTGGIWAGGGEWLVAPEESPWLPLVVGLAAGLGAHGVAEAIQAGR